MQNAPASGLIVQTTLIRAFPDNEGARRRVSLESRKGMWSLSMNKNLEKIRRQRNALFAFGSVVGEFTNDGAECEQTKLMVST